MRKIILLSSLSILSIPLFFYTTSNLKNNKILTTNFSSINYDYQCISLDKFNWRVDPNFKTNDNTIAVNILSWVDQKFGNDISSLSFAPYYDKNGKPVDNLDNAYYTLTSFGQSWNENPNAGVGDFDTIMKSGTVDMNDDCKLNNILLPSTIRSIGVNFFMNIGMYEYSNKISNGANIDLSNCINLAAGDNTGLREYVFSYSSINTIVFPKNAPLTYIGDDDFEYSRFYNDIDFSSMTNITTVGHWAFAQFKNCSNNQAAVKLPSSIKNITWAAFCDWMLIDNIDYLYIDINSPSLINWEVNLEFGLFMFNHIKELHIPVNGDINAWKKKMDSFLFCYCSKIIADIK